MTIEDCRLWIEENRKPKDASQKRDSIEWCQFSEVYCAGLTLKCVTDGSNSGGGLFRKMKREMGYKKFGNCMKPIDKQPFLEKYGLWQIKVMPERAEKN